MIQTHSKDFWRATLALCIGSVMVFSNLYITQPLLPQLTEVFDIDSLQATLSLSVATLSLGGALLLFGPLSDAFGRRVIIHTTLVLLCLTTLATAFVTDYHTLLILRGLQGVFIAGLPAAAMAYMGEEFEPQGLLLAVGLYIGANSLGGVSGRLISGLAAAEWGWSSSFLVLAGFDLLCVALVIWLLPASSRFQPKPFSPSPVIHGLATHLRNPLILAACFVGGLNFMIFVNQYSYITFVLAAEPFRLSSSWLGMLFLTYLSGTLAAAVSGRLVRNRSQPIAMGVGIVLFMCGSLMTLNQQLFWIVSGLFINALGFFFTHSLAAGWVAGHAKRSRGSATSLYLMFYYAGATLGGFYLEPFWRWLAWSGVVAASLLILIVTLGLSLWLVRFEKAQATVWESEPTQQTDSVA
ncbi:MFS transporter [Candidatus Thiodiazotropha endoloripes]|uniref:MFS transporter n=1 Tax=Candidatus Thiodiazotropha endoloripes TaxID=1818881 RepID=UPI00083DE2D8|nr:MFS transporter [Candidatus Thiodiazotropha endoloripes]ODB82153.1 MFS transporter [Candidatus Thiodiazotropha endoloripes]